MQLNVCHTHTHAHTHTHTHTLGLKMAMHTHTHIYTEMWLGEYQSVKVTIKMSTDLKDSQKLLQEASVMT